jgi:ATP-binding cassette subfamily F protein uup
MIGKSGTAKLALASDNEVRTKSVIVAENVSKSFPAADGAPARPIIKNFTLRIQRGDRIGVVGANGTGKTTLLRLLTGGLEPDEGKVTLAKTLNGVMIDQQRSLLSGDKKVRDVLAEGGDWVDVRGVRTHVQGYLKDFLFDPSLVDTPIAALSGGERSRLLLAREFARKSNLLVLDEPTNDLDLETLDLLQEVIADYDGTVLIVSHDRDFLDRTVTVTLGLDGSGTVDIVAGGYEDWAARRKPAPAPAKPKAPRPTSRDSTPSPSHAEAAGAVGTRAKARLTYKDQRDYDLLPGRIEQLDAELAEGEQALADPGLYQRDPDRFAELTARLDRLRAEKDAAEERWLALAEQVEG